MILTLDPDSLNNTSPTFTVPSSHEPCYIHDRQKMTRATFPSLKSRNATTPTLLSSLSPQSSGANQERAALTNQFESSSCFLSKQQFGSPPLLQNVSEEAMQLIQFCNHCSIDIGPAVHGSALQKEPGLSSSEQGTSSDHYSYGRSNICSCTNAFQDLEDEGNKHYPFITRPTGDNNLALSQINSGTYFTEPGPPRELVVKKYPQGSKNKSSLYRSCVSLDDAIRPVVYDWNAWWEKEHIQCALSNETLLECRYDGNSNNKISEEGPQSSRKTLTPVSTRKMLNSTFLAPKDSKWVSLLPSAQSKECQQGKTSGKSPNRKSKKGKGQPDKQYPDQPGISPLMRTPPNSPVDHRDKMTSTRKKVVRVCANLRLIISIPFRKLITERQLKKYCGEGGKYHICTPPPEHQ